MLGGRIVRLWRGKGRLLLLLRLLWNLLVMHGLHLRSLRHHWLLRVAALIPTNRTSCVPANIHMRLLLLWLTLELLVRWRWCLVLWLWEGRRLGRRRCLDQLVIQEECLAKAVIQRH